MKKKKQEIISGNMQYRKLNTLIPHPENPRFITKDGYETLKYSKPFPLISNWNNWIFQRFFQSVQLQQIPLVLLVQKVVLQ